MSGGSLAVVATPIGNLGDMSPRAAETLKGCAMVLAEDTRHSRPLLDRVGFSGTLLSCHAHNEDERVADVLARIGRGERVGLVTDAGAPAVSDPGGRIIAAVADAGLRVEVIPGPSALVAALMGAGIDATRFAFLGFIPRSGAERERIVMAAASAGLALLLYEAPKRAQETLDELFAWLGPRRVVVARELTKLHETFHRGVLGAALTPPLKELGELVIVVEGGAVVREQVDVEALARDASLPPRERARRIAKALGISGKEAYARVMHGAQQGPATDDDPAQHVRLALSHLGDAARALVDADRTSGGEAAAGSTPQPSDIDGADALMALMSRSPALRAPVEASDAARCLLAAMASMDALLDALAFERESGIDPRTRGR